MLIFLKRLFDARRSATTPASIWFPVLYSWPSHGKALAYRSDQETVLWTSSHLSDFMRRLRTRFPSLRLNVLADGLGCRALLSALAAFGSENQKLLRVIFARPDVDLYAFTELAQKLPAIASSVTLYVSDRDRSLLASSQLHASPRAGSTVQVIPGVDTVDVSAADTALVNAGFTEGLLGDLRGVLLGISPEKRLGLHKAETVDGTYWILENADINTRGKRADRLAREVRQQSCSGRASFNCDC